MATAIKGIKTKDSRTMTATNAIPTTDDNMATIGSQTWTVANKSQSMNGFKASIGTAAKTLGIVSLTAGDANKFGGYYKILYLSQRYMFTAMVANT